MVMGVHQKKLRVKVVHGEKRLRTTAIFLNVCVSLRILLTIPATVASAEKSVSKLKLMKNCLSTMYQTRLVDLAAKDISEYFLQYIHGFQFKIHMDSSRIKL